MQWFSFGTNARDRVRVGDNQGYDLIEWILYRNFYHRHRVIIPRKWATVDYIGWGV
jgi:hypothetical protein